MLATYFEKNRKQMLHTDMVRLARFTMGNKESFQRPTG